MPETDQGLYWENIRLVAHDVDYQNKWKMSSIFSQLQEVANGQCILHGCSWDDLLQQYNACFILSRMRIEMQDYPKSGETVRITTWPAANPRAIFTRYFTLSREDGSYLGGATSQWALFQKDTRTLMKATDCRIDMPVVENAEPPVVMPRRQEEQETGNTRLRTPCYSDFDYNGHMNNARYVEWTCDLFPLEDYTNGISYLDVKYSQEIRSGEEVLLEWSKTEEGDFFVRGRKEGEERIFFTASGHFN